MVGRSIKAGLLALIVCLASTALAQGSTRAASQVPSNLRSRVLKLGAACHTLPASLGQKDACGGSPAAMKLFDKLSKSGLKGVSQLKALYHQGVSLCQQLQASRNDGPPVQVLISTNRKYSQLDCYWGRAVVNHVVLTLRVPNPGKTLPRIDCDGIPDATGIPSCSAVAGGVSATISYMAPDRVGRRIVSTTSGYVDFQRWASTLAAFNSYQGSDARLFSEVTAALGLPK